MDSKKIEELLQKYWDCETSLEEEKELQQFFRNENVPDQWKETATLFHYFEQQKNQSVNPQFDKTMIDQLKKPKGKVTNLVQTSLKIAAGVAVLLAAVFFVRKKL